MSKFIYQILIITSIFLFNVSHACIAQSQIIEDDFEGNGTITSWYGDDCLIDTSKDNINQQGINNSETVLEYRDIGGQYANIRFDVDQNFDLSSKSVFSLKIYVPSSGITGNQAHQISLKLQDGTLDAPWSTQSEIIKPIALDIWQEVSFDFKNDPFINLDAGSPAPTQRGDFNRVVIQVNGENNNDEVVAYLDDVFYDGIIIPDPEIDILVWSDEFDVDGPINTANWHHQTLLPAGGSWYNGEIQHYTDREDNSYVSNGVLYIVGKKESFTDQGHTKQYTSARLNSKFAFQYGKLEVRAKLPSGIGTWPAIWTLGKNINEDGAYWDNQGFGTTGWPACGEIDLMEHWGTNQNYVQSATHTPSSSGATFNIGGQNIPTASTEFHTYTLEWYPEKLVFSVDGSTHFTYKPTVQDESTWPFDAEQYVLLNFAFLPNIANNFIEDALEIDYVRIYQGSSTSSTTHMDRTLFELKNVPNPATDFTTISYYLPSQSKVKLYIHDVNGQLISTLVDTDQPKGTYEVNWDLTNVSSGVYFYTLQIGNSRLTEKCIIYK